MNKEQILQNFGLTEAEVSLYITLLKLGESTASELSEKTNTNRTFTYDRLKKLLDSGLVSYVVKDNKKYFKAAEPSQLLSIIKEKEEQVKGILPELEKLKAFQEEGPKAEIFSSKKGIRTVLNLILKEKKEVLIHGSIIKFKESMDSYYEIWNNRRVKEKIKAKVLTNEEIEIPFTDISLLNEEEKSSITTFTFGNKVIITLWSDVPVAILIKSKEIAQDNIKFFYNLWEREIKIYSGVEGIRRAWMELVLEKSKELVGFGFSWDLARIYGRDFSNKWHKQRSKNNIPARLISYNDKNSNKYFNMRMIEWKNFNISFLDKDICGPACITLSDNLIVTFLYTEKKFRVIVSKNKEMISVYRKHFETLWKNSKKS
ncbi:MAG TPA: helix-turn-helix domain-containing protein [Candidatus Woesearchaeota archaeon]|jgi:sugar-specific transcriptional regulator TrmB|nr:helix-turn-helix domain-containing protein [Candidatus Woesearchaeota archaeon]|tara:strand:- start:1555 stop:2673 length:1119 start_codon:yes stop_codon:yes gene_type:complete